MSFRRILAIGLLALSPLAFAQTTQTFAGLEAEATLLTDSFGVTKIVAQNERDAAFLQGYIHARDRFFQMDLTRRAVSGTLAELFGSAVLADDIQARTIGLRRAAFRSLQASSDGMRAVLRAYTNGVNAWLAEGNLPLEYTLLELDSAEPWSAVDSLVVGKGLAFQLSFDLDIDQTIKALTYQGVGDAVGFDGAALFFEDTHRSAPADGRVSIPGFLSTIGGVGKSTQTASRIAMANPELTLSLAKSYRDKIADHPLLGKTLGVRDGRGGSNWWAVAGTETASGQPLIANDPHLGLNTPSTFAEGHIVFTTEGGDMINAAGVTVPGAPGIIQGCNDFLCWGSTVHPMDVTDVYREQLLLNSYGLPTHTVHSGVAEPIIPIFQSFYVNGVGDGEIGNVARANVGYTEGGITFEVPRRLNGALLDVDVANAVGLSVQYTGFAATQEIEAFRQAIRAENVNEFAQALTYFDVGSQNFAVTDASGNIAYFTSAENPIRTDLQTLNAPDGGVPPFLIRDGSGALAHDWLPVQNPDTNQAVPFEIMPMAEMPQVINPASGYIANANNDPIGVTLDNNPLNQLRPGGGLYYLNPGYSDLRMGRIDRILEAMVGGPDPVTLDDMKVLQANNQMLDAELLMPYIAMAFSNAQASDAWPGLAQFNADPRLAPVMMLMMGWDYSTPTGIAEGYDPFENPLALSEPSDAEINASVAATIYSMWRARIIKNTIDATLSALTLGDLLPGSRESVFAIENLLENFDTDQGIGASGINFFTNPDAPTAADARDFVILASLLQGLDMLASDEFAPAFANSTNFMDYRWGKLHRIVFDQPLGPELSLPDAQGLYGFSTVDGLPGAPRSGGYQVVDASSHSARADGLNEYMFGSGPARRFVGITAPGGVVGEQIIPGGQSGSFGDPNYGSQLVLWLVNGYKPLARSLEAAQAVAVDVVTVGPAQ